MMATIVNVIEADLYGSNLGRSGNTYAIATKDRLGVPLRLDQIGRYVEQFLVYARNNSDVTFVVAAGLASAYTRAAIGPMFANAPANCQLPKELKP